MLDRYIFLNLRLLLCILTWHQPSQSSFQCRLVAYLKKSLYILNHYKTSIYRSEINFIKKGIRLMLHAAYLYDSKIYFLIIQNSNYMFEVLVQRQLLLEIRTVLSKYGNLYDSILHKIQVSLDNHVSSLKYSLVNTRLTSTSHLLEEEQQQIQSQKQILSSSFDAKTTMSSRKTQLNESGRKEKVFCSQIILKPIDPFINSTNTKQIKFCFLDYSPTKKRYQPVSIRQSAQSIFEQLMDLVTQDISGHVAYLPLTQNIQQALIKPGRLLKPIIIPIANKDQYAFIFQTVEHKQAYNFIVRSDRFLVFIAPSFCYAQVCKMAKQITGMPLFQLEKQYQNRFCLGDTQYMLDQSLASLQNRPSFLSSIDRYIGQQQLPPYSRNIQDHSLGQYLKTLGSYSLLIRFSNLHFRRVSLIALLLFYIVRQAKIVVVAYKENRHIQSQIAMTLRKALDPLEYTYPTLLTTITEHHQTYLDVPVPSTICYWGKNCQQVKELFNTQLQLEQKLPLVLIDANSQTVSAKILSKQECDTLQKIDKFLQTKHIKMESQSRIQQKNSVVDRIRRYVDKIINESSQFKQESAFLKQTSMFHALKSSLL